MKIEGYCNRTWFTHFKQLALLPCPYICYNPTGNFIEQGVYSGCLVISVNFLIWDFGIRIA